MSQPVKLSDELVCDARLTGEVSERSIAGQIEFWAQLGRALEPLLRGDRVVALRRASAGRSLSEAVEEVDSESGHKRVVGINCYTDVDSHFECGEWIALNTYERSRTINKTRFKGTRGTMSRDSGKARVSC